MTFGQSRPSPRGGASAPGRGGGAEPARGGGGDLDFVLPNSVARSLCWCVFWEVVCVFCAIFPAVFVFFVVFLSSLFLILRIFCRVSLFFGG